MSTYNQITSEANGLHHTLNAYNIKLYGAHNDWVWLGNTLMKRTLNPFIAGSIPAQPTNKEKVYSDVDLSPYGLVKM